MTTTTKIEFNDYLKLFYELVYRKFNQILLLILGIMFLLISLLDYLAVLELTDEPMFQLIMGIALIFVFPILYYFLAKKNFKTNKFLNGQITYQFEGSQMKAVGENFSSEINLNAAYKIEEFKHWFLIYHSKQTANFISKQNMSNDDVLALRMTFSKLQGVKIKLKN